MKNNIGKILLHFFTISFYILIWVFIGLVSLSFHELAGFTVFEDFYGRWILWLGGILTISAFLSPLYLRLFLKKKLKAALLSFAITIIFVLSSWGLLWFTESQFLEFTPEKWEQYPRQRFMMVEDLEANHGFIGMTADEVVSILGVPDLFSKDRGLRYNYMLGSIIFNTRDGAVVSIAVLRAKSPYGCTS